MNTAVGITLADFKALVRSIAAERPDYVYNRRDEWRTCVYGLSVRHDDKESRCIIGETLFRLGFTEEELRKHSEFTPGMGNTADLLLMRLGFSEHVAVWARKVQSAQDTGETWGKAVEAE